MGNGKFDESRQVYVGGIRSKRDNAFQYLHNFGLDICGVFEFRGREEVSNLGAQVVVFVPDRVYDTELQVEGEVRRSQRPIADLALPGTLHQLVGAKKLAVAAHQGQDH